MLDINLQVVAFVSLLGAALDLAPEGANCHDSAHAHAHVVHGHGFASRDILSKKHFLNDIASASTASASAFVAAAAAVATTTLATTITAPPLNTIVNATHYTDTPASDGADNTLLRNWFLRQRLRQMMYGAASSSAPASSTSSSDKGEGEDGVAGDGGSVEVWINYDEPRGGAICYKANPSDTLKFYWDEYHNLKELVDKAAYDSCNFSGATNHQSKGEPNPGGTFITL